MVNQPLQDDGNLVLKNVREGMTVIDAHGDRIGTVDYVHFGEGDAAATNAGVAEQHDRLTEVIANIFGPTDTVPDELRSRLYQRGFLRVDGLLAPRRYITPDEIGRIHDDHVHLTVGKDSITTL